MMRRFALITCGLVLLAACSSTDVVLTPDTVAAPASTPAIVTDHSGDAGSEPEAAAAPDTVAPTPASVTTPSPAPAPTTVPTPTVAAVVEEVLVPSFTPMTLLTPASGQGLRPLLAWEPVNDAVHYAVTLFEPGGRAYWASLVIEEQTYVGGPEQIDEDKPGPSVIPGMNWMVVAYDENQLPIAISGQRPIGP